MYVIFPADEVVYLSYGRLIYVPLSPSPDNQVNLPIRTTSVEEAENHFSQHNNPSTITNSTNKNSAAGQPSQTSVDPKPGPSYTNPLDTSRIRERNTEQASVSDLSKPGYSKLINIQKLEPENYGSLDRSTKNLRKTPERAFNSNSNKSSKSSKQSSVSSKSRSQPSASREKIVPEVSTQASGRSRSISETAFSTSSKKTGKPISQAGPSREKIIEEPFSPVAVRGRTFSETVNCNSNKKPNRFSSSSFRSFLRPSSNREKTPELPPVRPERKKNKKGLRLPTSRPTSPVPERKVSYSDYLAVSREKTEIPRSNIINTRSDQFCNVKAERSPAKREKSPAFRFFRAASSSPRNLGRDRTAFDFDNLFKREASPGKLSVKSVPQLSREGPGSSSGGVRSLPISEKSSPAKKKAFFSSAARARRTPEREVKMAGNESPLRDLIHPGYNEQLKSHNAVTFKLVRTVSDFTQQLGQMYEQHAEELQMLVANFRKRNGELRKERPACPSSLFHTWETLLQEVEIDSQVLGDIASILGRQVSRPLLERSFHRKIQSRKVFTHRESYETIIAKTEEKLAKSRQEYKNAYLSYLAAPSTESLSAYFNTHNAYIQQLHATNGMMEEFGKCTLPSLLQELEEIYTDLCSTVTDAVLQGAEVVSSRAMEQSRRYEGLVAQCKAVSGPADLTHLSRSLPVPTGRGPVLKRIFVPPQPPPPPDMLEGEAQDVQVNDNIPPPLRNELVIDRLSAVQIKPSHDALRKESYDLEAQIRQIQDALDTLLRIQQRSVEASLYNKANELQEDISMKRFDLRVAQIHLSAINSQKELFTSKLEGETTGRERKMSAASTGSMKNKWLKAFKSLKTPPPEAPVDKKNGSAATRELLKGDPDAHNFQEYTYKKITPCDVCSQVLRGHTRQGLKCRICKMNIHLDCQDKASKCQTKARLLRRQKSTSEIETRVPETNVEDERIAEVYSMPTINRRLSIRNNNRLYPPPNAVAIERNSQDASGTRPFGQPLCLGPQNNGNSPDLPPIPQSPSPTPSKGKNSPLVKKGAKSKK